MHVPAIGFQWGGSGDRLGSLCSFHLVHNYLLAVRHFGGNYDNLSDTEILRAQPGICLADALCGYSIALCQLVQGFTRLDGMEHLLFRSDVLLWNLQCFTGFNFLVAAGVHFNDITGSDIIHAGYGIKTLPFGDGVQEIAGRLCLSHHSGAAGRQGCDKI